jgi:hypothetical protein
MRCRVRGKRNGRWNGESRRRFFRARTERKRRRCSLQQSFAHIPGEMSQYLGRNNNFANDFSLVVSLSNDESGGASEFAVGVYSRCRRFFDTLSGWVNQT